MARPRQMDPGFASMEEVMAAAGASERTIRNWMDRGLVPTPTKVSVPMMMMQAETAEQLASPSGPHLRADAGRDARVLAAALLQDLLDVVKAEVGALLLDERPAGIDALHDRVEDLVTTSRQFRRRLSDHRVMCRGQSPGHPPPPATIPRLALPFRHRGDYVGWFTGMAAAGEALGVESMRDAHLRGDLWTVAQGGIVHVFRCRPVLAGCKSPTCQPSATPPSDR